MIDIEISNLSINYGSVNVLENINLKLRNRSILGIKGPNGGGKTTLIKAILGLVEPSIGSIKIRKNLNISYVPQFKTFSTDFPISVLEVVTMGNIKRKCLFFSKYKVNKSIQTAKILEKFGLDSLKHRQIGELSGGQLQKVLLARAMYTDPDILILDEPTSNIDQSSKKEIFKILKELSTEKSIIMISHEDDFFAYCAETIVFIDRTLLYHKSNLLPTISK